MDKFYEFKKLVEPVQEWLRENYNPHATAVITSEFAKVTTDEFGYPTNGGDDK